MGGCGLDHLADSGWPERPNLVSPEQVAQQVPGGHLQRSRSSSLITLPALLLPTLPIYEDPQVKSIKQEDRP